MKLLQGISPERGAVAFVPAALAACLGAVALSLAHLSFGLALAPAALLAVPFWRWLALRLPTDWDGLAGRRPLLCALWLLLGLAAVARTGGVALFMADVEQAQLSAYPFDDFYIQHSCYSSYWKGAVLANDRVPNVYDLDPYEGRENRFKLDVFIYPPQFLLLPQIGLALGGDFLQLRAAWFVLEGAVALALLLALGFWMGGVAGRRTFALLPLTWLATPLLLTLQIGNFQPAAIALAVLALLAFERGRHALGGAALAFTLCKIYPGILCVYLLCTRQWRALAWTVAFGALYTVLVWAVLGPAPIEAFVNYQLPRIAGGDNWNWLEGEGMEPVVAINQSIPGLILKLRLLGVSGMDHAAQVALTWAWSILVVVLAVLAARRAGEHTPVQRAAAWLALLSLAALRSPFVPDTYGLVPVLWLWLLVVADAPLTRGRIVLYAGLYLAFANVLPFSGMPLPDLFGRLLLGTTAQLLAIALCLGVLVRGSQRSPRIAPVPALAV